MIDPEIQFPDTPFPLQPTLALLCRRGSEAHGTYIPSTDPNGIDDRDLLGICVPPRPYLLGLRTWDHAESIKGVWDVVLYDLRKFVGLLLKQNPNVLSALWLEEEDYLHVTAVGRALIQSREIFCAREPAYRCFVGYAHDQLRKMTRGAFNGYMGAKRKALVEKWGYDTKNAAHLVRLLHMGEEYLLTGQLQVRRTHDVDMIKSIKRGEWRLEQVQTYAAEKMRALADAKSKSVLPEYIDEEAVEGLMLGLLSGEFAKWSGPGAITRAAGT